MTAYAPRHAVTQPRTCRLSPWRRARRVLLSLLPARTVTVSFTDEEVYAAMRAQAPAADRFFTESLAWAEIDRRSATLTDTEIAALTPTWAVRRDGLVTVTASGEVEVYPSPLAWEPDNRVTAAMPVISRQDHEELPAEFDDRPGPEVLQRVLDGLRAIPEQGDYGTMPAERVIAAELPQVIAL